MEKSVSLRREGHIARITLNRPAQYNVINTSLAADYTQALKQCRDDDASRAIVLTGSGKAFCAGGDLKFFNEKLKEESIGPAFKELMPAWNSALLLMREMPKPIIAALNGVTAGGGMGLALACDFRIASSAIILQTAFLGIGLSPDSSISFFLPRYVGMGRATELLVKNRPITADKALDLGLVSSVVPPEKVMDEAMALAQELAMGPAEAIARTKQLLNKSLESPLSDQLDSEARLITQSARSPDFSEGMTAFLEKRRPSFS